MKLEIQVGLDQCLDAIVTLRFFIWQSKSQETSCSSSFILVTLVIQLSGNSCSEKMMDVVFAGEPEIVETHLVVIQKERLS